MDFVRCFVAVEVPEEVRKKVVEIQKGFSPLFTGKSVEEQNIHVTLAFFTKDERRGIPENRVFRAEKMLERIFESVKRFRLELEGLTIIPNVLRPRVLLMNVSKGKKILETMQKEIRIRLRVMGLTSLTNEPHLTLARTKFISSKDLFKKMVEQKSSEKLGFKVDKVVFKKSVLTPEGPIYSNIRVYDLV